MTWSSLTVSFLNGGMCFFFKKFTHENDFTGLYLLPTELCGGGRKITGAGLLLGLNNL